MRKIQILWGLIVVVLVAIIVAGVWLYTGKFNDTKAQAFKKLSLPVAVVGNHPVSGKEFLSRFELAQSLYKDDPTFKTTEAQTQILDQLIEDQKLRSVASQHNVQASPDEINTEYTGIVNEFAGGDEGKFRDMLTQTYHLNTEEFKSKVLSSDILKTNLSVWFNGQKELNQKAFEQQDKLLQMLDQGQSFEEVVKNYTQDEATKDFGGDIGSVKLAELASEFRQPLSNVQAGDRVLVISRYGLHILKVVEVNRSETEPSYHLQQIFIQETGFDDWYTKQANAIKARKLIEI